MLRRAALFGAFALFLGIGLSAEPASALVIECCDQASDWPDPSDLGASFDFSVSGTTLTLVVTNTDPNAQDFDINQIFFNGTSDVTSIALVSVTHSAAGDVTTDWDPLNLDVEADGFGRFDFQLQDGDDESSAAILEPGEFITLIFTVNAGLSDSDFDDVSEDMNGDPTTNRIAARFVHGPDDASTFGTVPEPHGALLLLAALVAGTALRSRALR